MKSLICFLASVAYVSAVGVGILLHDDGHWKPSLDNSWRGSGIDGQWYPALDNSWAGSGKLAWGQQVGLVGGLGHSAGLIAASPLLATSHLLHKRSVLATPWAAHGLVAAHAGLINPNALNVPLDTVHVAAAKNAQLISQATEGARNIHGGGIPLALPADTHEVAAGKVAHAIAHETERANHWANAGHGWTAAAGQGLWAGRALGWGAHGAAWGVAAPHGLIGAHGLW